MNCECVFGFIPINPIAYRVDGFTFLLQSRGAVGESLRSGSDSSAYRLGRGTFSVFFLGFRYALVCFLDLPERDGLGGGILLQGFRAGEVCVPKAFHTFLYPGLTLLQKG